MNCRILPLFLLITLLTTSVFGLLLMSEAQHAGMPCSIPTMTAVDCTTLSNALAMTQHHVSSFQMLFAAIIAMVLSIVVNIFIRWCTVLAVVRREDDISLRRHAVDMEMGTSSLRRFQRWLARLIARDAFVFVRVREWSS